MQERNLRLVSTPKATMATLLCASRQFEQTATFLWALVTDTENLHELFIPNFSGPIVQTPGRTERTFQAWGSRGGNNWTRFVVDWQPPSRPYDTALFSFGSTSSDEWEFSFGISPVGAKSHKVDFKRKWRDLTFTEVLFNKKSKLSELQKMTDKTIESLGYAIERRSNDS